MQYHVDITRDPVSHVWFTRRSDVPGLAMYDRNVERLMERLPRVIPYLILVNDVQTGPELAIELAVKIHDRGEVKEPPVQVIPLADGMPTATAQPPLRQVAE